jgi:hypothetical protein
MNFTTKIIEEISGNHRPSHIHLIDDFTGRTFTNYEGVKITDLNTIVPGMVIRILKDGMFSMYIVDSYGNDTDISEGINVRLIDVDYYADVYKWNVNKGKFEEFFTGDPEHLLEEDDCDCGEHDADLHAGDIVFITEHGNKKPFIQGEYNDPTGVYIVSTDPKRYGIEDEDDDEDLEFIPVYRISLFLNEYGEFIINDDLIEFMNNFIQADEED